MKKICAVMITGIVALLINVQAFAQINMPIVNDSVIAPYRLAITYYKTTNLIFPYPIKSVDRGSKDILVQKAKDVENILQIKAGKLHFTETNLTVITTDGKLYSYILNYEDTPAVINIIFDSKVQRDPETFFSDGGFNEAEMKTDAESIIRAEKFLRGIRNEMYGVNLQLEGIYINQEVIYLRIRVSNQTNINYDINQFRFFIRDQKKSKRTTTQEIEIYPLHIYNDASVIEGQSGQLFVFAVPKFTIPDKKFLAIQLMEKNGGRNLKLSIHNKTIVKAKRVIK